MRLLCFGDLHLGAGTDYGCAPYGPGSRLDDQRLLLDRILDVAMDEACEGILFAGDAFHRRRPSPSEIVVWRDFITRAESIGLDIVAIDGNHDVVSADLPSALETVKPRSSYEVSRRPTVIGLGRSVYVATLPWTPPARLVASRNGGDRDAIHDDVAELLLGAARELREEITFRARDRNGPHTAILMLHWSISGASTPSGIPTDLFREPVIPAAGLEELGFDFIVAGHIHKPQVVGALKESPNLFYTGSPCVIDFGEANVEHGVWIIDTEERTSRFVQVEDRRFITYDVDHTDGDDFSQLLEGYEPHLEHWRFDGAVVRVRYTATPEQARRIDHPAIRQSLIDAGASKVYAIQPTIIREDRARVEGVDENLEPLAAFDAWLASQGITGDKADALRERAGRYLEDVRA